MSNELNLSLNDENKQGGSGGKGLYILLALTLIIASATLATVIILHGGEAQIGGGGSGERLEELALKLEKRELGAEAADAWKEYLEAADPDREESGKIWYRIGKIYQENGDYPGALAAYYRAESFGPLEGLENDISGRVTECLEMMGKFSALESELADRTSISERPPEGKVIAEIGSRKITDTEVKQMIEDEIDNAIEGAAPGLAGEQRNRQKEMMIENAMKPENRKQWISNYIAKELIYREAVRDGLHRDPEYKRICEKEERDLLVQRYLNLLYGRKINITEDTLRDYYRNNSSEFTGADGGQLNFEEAMQQVYARVRMREENRVQQELMNRLRDSYDMVIHSSTLSAPADSLGSLPVE
ncbi:MAG: hypothetical protein R6U43_10200 [Candidatus Krumholzibacteriales bacterium]